jgi:ferric enterobactin receptor
MKTPLLTLAVLALTMNFLSAQHVRITGLLMDSTASKPVEFATVALLKDGKIMEGVTADAKGRFVFAKVAPGVYIVQASLMGYTTKTFGPVHADKEDVEIGVIKLATAAQDLKEVTVSEQKALFEERSDRMVYNAEKDISIKGGDATDVLKKIPSISVDIEGNVQLRGSGNIKVLINNKPLPTSLPGAFPKH